MEDTTTSTTTMVIDETYEFSAPRYYDFIIGETDDDVRIAELWFETALSHAPSPFMMRIKTPRSVQLTTSCDFGNSEQQQQVEVGDLHQAAEVKESNPNTASVTTDNPVIDQVSSVGEQNEELQNKGIHNEDGSTLTGEPTPHLKTVPEKIRKSVTGSSQGVCTPKPPVHSGKGSLATSQLKKQQTAKKTASALKNPSALKSKIQSHLSHTKSAKPSGVLRDVSNLKSSLGTPNLAQDNQAIKRQKLDCGKSRQILSIKPPSLPHKMRPAAATASTNACSMVKTSNDGRKIYVREQAAQATPFVSMAEMLKKFQSSTKDASLTQSSMTQGKTKLTLTRPKEPEFETTQRLRSVKVKSSAELEEELMAKMPKFKARPLNKKILEAPSLPPLPKSVPHQPEFQEFHLETMERANKNAEVSSVVSVESGPKKKHKWNVQYLTEPKTPVLHTSMRARPTQVKSSLEIEQEELEKIPRFKARPLNKKIFESKGELGLFCNNKKQVTVPQEFKFAIDERIPPPQSSVTDLFDKLSLNSEGNHEKPIHRVTAPSPFHLYTEERGAEKERRLLMELLQKQMEEEQARVPKAHPYPYTTDFPVVPPKPEPKESTKPEPFQLESLVRHEEEMRREMEEKQKKEREEARMRRFKAQPVLKVDPIPLPEKERKPLTEVQEFNLHIEHRAVDRAEFDKKIKEKEMMYKRYREEAESEKQMEEQKAVKQLRRTLVPHARPIPNFANPFIPQKSDKGTTRPKSPKLRVLRRKERKHMINDLRAATSAAAALMR